MQLPAPEPEPALWCIDKLSGTDADDYFLSTHALYQEYCEEFDCRDLSYEDFDGLLRSEPRLYVTPGAGPSMPSPQQEVLAGLGFPSHALVALSARRPSGEALDSAITAKAAQLQHALHNAWEARPTEGPRADEVEKKLLFLMEQAKKLCEMLEAAQGKQQ